MKKIIVLILLLTMSAVYAQTKVGTTAANFLTIPVSPRASAMGGAFVATANDVSALYWNPGGISRLGRNEIEAAYSEWLVGTNYNWIGIVYKLDDNDAVGFSINQLNYGQDEVTTVAVPDGTGEKWDAQDLSIGISYARNLTDRFSIGGTVKYIRQQIWHETASAFALDIGLLFHTQLDGLRIGMNISNFGSEMQLQGKDLLQPIDIDRTDNSGNNPNVPGSLNTDSWALPLVFTVGVAYDALRTGDFRWTLATDAVYPNNQTSYLNVGTEATYDDLVSLRVGYNSLFKQDSEEGLCAGIGLKYDLGPIYAKIDYSYNDYGIFKSISKVSLTIGF
jgi:hypothetical protein